MMIPIAATIAAFNLVCTGQETDAAQKRATDSVPFSEIYRINLANGRWCSGDCKSTQPLVSVTASMIVIANSKDPITGDRVMAKVNRETGDYEQVRFTQGFIIARSGTCKRQPFTGFPAIKF